MSKSISTCSPAQGSGSGAAGAPICNRNTSSPVTLFAATTHDLYMAQICHPVWMCDPQLIHQPSPSHFPHMCLCRVQGLEGALGTAAIPRFHGWVEFGEVKATQEQAGGIETEKSQVEVLLAEGACGLEGRHASELVASLYYCGGSTALSCPSHPLPLQKLRSCTRSAS